MAVKKGYKNIYWFKGGIKEWRRFNYPMEINNKYQGIKIKKISPMDVAQYLKNDSNIFILDVRPKNFTKDPRFIKGAFHSPLLKISDHIKTLPRDKKIIVSDWAMRQSLLAAKYLAANGFLIMGVVRGGIERWVSDGLPIEQRESEAF